MTQRWPSDHANRNAVRSLRQPARQRRRAGIEQPVPAMLGRGVGGPARARGNRPRGWPAMTAEFITPDMVITIRQPWASAIARGWKGVEIRSHRPPALDQWVAIHAAAAA